MATLWTFGSHRPGPARSTAEALAGRLTSLIFKYYNASGSVSASVDLRNIDKNKKKKNRNN